MQSGPMLGSTRSGSGVTSHGRMDLSRGDSVYPQPMEIARHSTTVRPGKFEHPEVTADGSERAVVPLIEMQTLWFNTGTVCNIECVNCYIESSPTNDRLVYLGKEDVALFLDEIESGNWPVTEIGFTGGEPFMNPSMIGLMDECLTRGYDVLVLTNAMRPMMRPGVQAGLLALLRRFGSKLTLRVSLDHYEASLHDEERGEGSYEIALEGLRWLRDHGFNIGVAGRTMWGEEESAERSGYQRLFETEGFQIDAFDPAQTILFPEMDEKAEVPEITTSCWSILNKTPADVMCSNSRMVVKRRGADRPAVVACTLLPYESEFELGETLEEASVAVRLNHPHCAKFCVLGGGSCSA